jgi:hypothetical protein
MEGSMTANGSDPKPSPLAPRPPRYCLHDGAREIRMYMPYAEANAVRLRLMHASDRPWRHVSILYEIPNGWAWTVCRECPADGDRIAAGE